MAKAILDREKGKILSIFRVNPRESVMAIPLRSRKVPEEPSVRKKPQIEKDENVKLKGEKVQAK